MNTSKQLQIAAKYHEQKAFEDAKKIYQQILLINPQIPEALHGLGMIALEEKNFADAVLWLQRATQMAPDNATCHHHLAIALQGLGEQEQAITLFEKTLSIDEQYAEAHNNYANLLQKMGEVDKALRHYIRAMQIAPDYLHAHYNAGLLLSVIGEVDAAIKQFNNVITLNPEMTIAHLKLGDLYLQQEKFSQAQQHYRYVIQQDPTNSDAYNNLGVIAIKNKDPELATFYFSKALLYEETNSEARNNLAATFLHHDNYENAITHYNILLQAKPRDQEANYNIGVAYMMIGELEKAISHFERVITENADHADSLSNLAAIYCRLSDNMKALHYYRLAQKIKPTDSSIDYMIAALTEKQSISRAPSVYIKNLFDNYALRFETHLKQLSYQGPNAVQHVLKTVTGKTTADWRVLDLGCGTGLSGVVLKSFSSYLVGVDLSEKMIREARKKNIYDALYDEDLITYFLKNTERHYDLIVAVDVFCYFGDLKDIFFHCWSALNVGGIFIFTLEQTAQQDYYLQSSARFAHHEEYITALATRVGFQVICNEKLSYRTEDNRDVPAQIFVLKKNMATR